MASLYASPEAIDARRRANGQRLTLAGAVLAILACVGIVLSIILKVVWLGILGAPIGALSWLALFAGVGLFVWGFRMIKSAHPIGRRL